MEKEVIVKRDRVRTPFGEGTANEYLGESIQVELDAPHKYENREYRLWIFDISEVTII